MNLTREGVYHVFKEEFLLFICIFKRLIIFPNELIYYIFSLYENIILPKISIEIDETYSFIFNNNCYSCAYQCYKKPPYQIFKEGFNEQRNDFPIEKIVSICYYYHRKYIISNKHIYNHDHFFGFDKSYAIPTSLLGCNISTRFGENYMLIHTTDGLYVHGCHNKYGQLGLGDKREYSVDKGDWIYDFKKIQINNVLMYDCGDKHTFILTQNGDLFCCGSNKYGQLGLYEIKFKQKILYKHHMTDIITFSCGSRHTFILTLDGLFSSGDNRHCQLGRTVQGYDVNYYFHQIDIENTLSFSCGSTTSLIMTISGLFLTDQKFMDGRCILTKIDLFVTKIILFKCGFKESIIITKDGVYTLIHNKIELPYTKKFILFDEDLWSQKARLFY